MPQGALGGFSRHAEKNAAILVAEERVRAPVSYPRNLAAIPNDEARESGHFRFPYRKENSASLWRALTASRRGRGCGTG